VSSRSSHCFGRQRILVIALALSGALPSARCPAAPAELSRAGAPTFVRPISPAGIAELPSNLGRGRYRIDNAGPPPARASTLSLGPVRRATDDAIPDGSVSADGARSAPGIRSLARAWGPSPPVGAHMPAAHVDLWSTSRGRVAIAVHRGVSLQARFVFGAP